MGAQCSCLCCCDVHRLKGVALEHILADAAPVSEASAISSTFTAESFYQELIGHEVAHTRVNSCITEEEIRMEFNELKVDSRLSKMSLSSRFMIAGAIATTQYHTPVATRNILAPTVQETWTDDNTIFNHTVNIRLPLHDEQPSSAISEETGVRPSKQRLIVLLNQLPIVDVLDDSLKFEDADEGVLFGQRLLGPALPRPRVHWNELASDESHAKVAYFGMGQVYLCKSDDMSRGDHMIDMRAMASLKVRDSFEKYGACAYFKEQALTSIFWSHGNKYVTPADPEWEHVKLAWRASVFTWVTAVDHLATSHLVCSTAITTSSRECFPPHHPVRRVIHPNAFGAAKVNVEAHLTLASEGCFLHRMTSLEWKGGLEDALKLGCDSFKYQTWPERVHASNLSDEVKAELPLFVDGLEVWNAYRNFYGEYLDMYYEDDASVVADAALVEYWKFRCVPQYSNGLPPLSKAALADQLTHGSFSVTAWHQAVGDVVQYLTSPSGYFFQIRPGVEMVDAEELSNVMALQASTGRAMPLLSEDWSHLLEPTCSVIFDQFINSLREASAAIDSRNKKRKIAYTELEPTFFECSVSI